MCTCLLSPNALAAVPSNNETIYLPLLMRSSDSHLLAGDWTFAGLLPDRPLFDFVFRPLAATRSWALAGWTGRLLGWMAVAAALVWLLSVLGFRQPWVAMAVGVGALANQLSPIAGEWVAGTFESKVFAYAALFAMLAALGRERWLIAGLLGGATFSLHNVVGLWSVFTLLVVVAVLRPRKSSVFHAFFGLVVGLLPGLVAMTRYLTNGGDTSVADLRIVTRHVLSFHMDPFTFARRDYLLLGSLAGASIVYDVIAHRDGDVMAASTAAGWRVFRTAEIVSGCVFLGGILARWVGLDSVLLAMPFRLAGVLIPVGAILRAGAACGAVVRWRETRRVRVATFALVANASVVFAVLCAVWFTGGQSLRERVDSGFFAADTARDDTARALLWSRTHLPPDAVVAVSPGHKGVFAELRRPTVASFYTVRFDAISQWRARVEDLSGVSLASGVGYALTGKLDEGYANRPIVAVRTWGRSYGVTHVVTTASYPLRELLRVGAVHVYELGG